MINTYDDNTNCTIKEVKYCYKFMFFGLKNVGTTYSYSLDEVFKKNLVGNIF